MLKVYIGTEPAQWLPTEVLKAGARRRTKSPIEFHELKNLPIKLHLKMYTGFSFYRFAIPEVCNFKGRALYLDADIIVLSDLQELFDRPMEKGVLARPNPPVSWYTSVMLLDCAQLKHWKVHDWVTLINNKFATYRGTLWGDPLGLSYPDFAPLEEFWNHLDHADGHTKLLHYTDVFHQPWKMAGHPYASLFLSELRLALEEKAISEADVEAEIAKKHIYPNILKDAYSQ